MAPNWTFFIFGFFIQDLNLGLLIHGLKNKKPFRILLRISAENLHKVFYYKGVNETDISNTAVSIKQFFFHSRRDASRVPT
jgi:hypothetical protein